MAHHRAVARRVNQRVLIKTTPIHHRRGLSKSIIIVIYVGGGGADDGDQTTDGVGMGAPRHMSDQRPSCNTSLRVTRPLALQTRRERVFGSRAASDVGELGAP